MAGDITARGGAYAVVAESLSHAPWSMTHSHTRAMSTNCGEKERRDHGKPSHTGGARTNDVSMRSEETIAAADVRRVSKRWASPSHALVVVSALMLCSCQGGGDQVTRLQARPVAPAITVAPGVYGLGMGARRLRDLVNRDGTLVIPKQAASGRPLPLIVLLHGGGGAAEDFRSTFPLADEYGVVMLALDSRHNTWDGIDSPFGPDVMALDAALRFTFERVAIDPKKIALDR